MELFRRCNRKFVTIALLVPAMSLWLTAPAHAVTGGSAEVVGTQLVPGNGCTVVSPIDDTLVRCPDKGVTLVHIAAGDQDDRIDYATKLPSVLSGGDGADVILGGPGRDFVAAGAGDDFVLSFEADDRVNGESGDDFLDGAAGTNRLDGGAGNDECVNGSVIVNCEFAPIEGQNAVP